MGQYIGFKNQIFFLVIFLIEIKAFPKFSAERSLLLLSSSKVFGYGYYEHSKDDITKFFNKNNVTKILFVPYAIPDHDAYTNVVSNVLNPWGYAVEGIHTKADPVEAISSAQAIFVGGGNTFVLLKKLYELNLVDAIREHTLKKGIPYIGSSAGTNLAAPSINTANDMPIVHPPTYEAFNLVPFNINPHYLEPDPNTKQKGQTRDQGLEEFVFYHKKPVLALPEGTVLLVEGDKVTLLGDKKAKLFRPKLEPIEFEPHSDLSFLLQEV